MKWLLLLAILGTAQVAHADGLDEARVVTAAATPLVRLHAAGLRVGGAGAASLLERFADLYAGENDAPAALAEAVEIRLALRDDNAAIDDAALYEKVFVISGDTARVAFAVAPAYARRGARAEARYLRRYLRSYGDLDDALAAAARARLAALSARR